jgi:hypothetical protein
MNNESQNANSLLTLNTTINTTKNLKQQNIKNAKKTTFLVPRKTMSTPILSIKIRKDIFGEIIKKGGKQKISFKDNILLCDNESNDDSEYLSENKVIKNDTNFVEIIDVVSYKEQNKQMSFKGNGEIPNDDIVCCDTCEIF